MPLNVKRNLFPSSYNYHPFSFMFLNILEFLCVKLQRIKSFSRFESDSNTIIKRFDELRLDKWETYFDMLIPYDLCIGHQRFTWPWLVPISIQNFATILDNQYKKGSLSISVYQLIEFGANKLWIYNEPRRFRIFD